MTLISITPAAHQIGEGLPTAPTATALRNAARRLHVLAVDENGQHAIPTALIPVFRRYYRLTGYLVKRGARSIDALEATE